MPPKLAGPTLADVMDKLSGNQNSLDSLTSELKSVKEKVQVDETQLNHIDASMNLLIQKSTTASKKIKHLETKSYHDNASLSMLEQRGRNNSI